MIVPGLQKTLRQFCKLNYPKITKVPYFTSRKKSDNICDYINTIHVAPTMYQSVLLEILLISIRQHIFHGEHIDIPVLVDLMVQKLTSHKTQCHFFFGYDTEHDHRVGTP